MYIFELAYKSITGNLKFYVPFLLILLCVAFVFCTLLSLAIGSSQIYKKSGSEDLLAVFEGNRACVFASLVPESFRPKIESVPHVVDITGEVRHLIVYAPKKSLTLSGVEPDKFRDFKDIKISEARYNNFMNDEHGVIIGQKVQKTFQWEIGQTVTLQNMKFTVHGVFKMPLSVYNGMIIFHKEYMQELVKKQGKFTAFTVRIDSPQNKSTVSKAIEQLFVDHPAGILCAPETEFWGRTEKQMGSFGKHMRSLTVLSGLLIFALLANGAAFCLKQRHIELKILKIAGFTRIKIFFLFLLEPVVAAVMAGLCGCLLAFVIWIKQPSIGGDQAILPPITVTPTFILMSLSVIFVFSILATILPAHKFSKG